MKPALLLATAALALSASARVLASPAEATAIRRFALVASSNDGGANRARLRFANSDAESVGHVLASLGGVRDADLILVREATRDRLRQAFADLKLRLGEEKGLQVRREVFVYYSGHSDENGLLLAGERLGYRELRQWIDGVGADVRIVILDSCASGSLIRLKGGVHRAPFLSDVSIQARGHAFLTASSADEAAQESDGVGAAFFTHFLLSGLRGAADANHDRRVTLNEAYQFAYDETLQRTEASRAGAQHPAYDIQLAGTGDLVMTDLHASSARLVLSRDLAGRIYVRDHAGRLVVELRKEPTYPVELGLESGTYRVVLDHDGSIFDGTFDLAQNGRVDVASSSLGRAAPMLSTLRGDAQEPTEAGQSPPAEAEPVADLSSPATAPQRYRQIGFDFVLAPGHRMSGNTGEPVEHRFLLGILGHSDHVRGVQLSLAGNISRDGVVGAQAGGMVALSYGPVVGLQAAGYNLAMGGLYGAQVGWVASVAKGPVRGAQVSLVNFAGDSMHGAQIGLANVARGDLSGAQVGLVNVGHSSQEFRGDQIGFANVAGGSGGHDQVGFANVARKLRGVQIGLVNVADEIDGVQVGLVSIAKKNTGASISLLPVVFDGDNRLTLGWNTTSVANLGFKLGTRRFYAVAAIGMTRDQDAASNREYSASFGLGAHLIPRGRRLYFDLDLVGTGFATAASARHYQRRSVGSLRLQVGYSIARHLAVVGGPTLNVQEASEADDHRPRGVNWAEHAWTSGSHIVRLYPGLTAGLEF